MRVVLDLQACQSPGSRRRGIGRYSLALAKAMAANPRGHEFIVLLNATLAEPIEYVRSQFDGLLPQSRLRVWDALAPTADYFPENRFRKHASEVLREQAIRALDPDIVHVTSLFEGLFDDLISTVPPHRDYRCAVTLYDLIPLVHSASYLTDPRTRSWYEERVEQLKRADLLLGISRFSCEEARELLAIPTDRLTDISGAADELFRQIEGADAFRAEVMARYGLARPFVMYAGGFDARKNIGALIRAYALLPDSLRRAHQLVIAGDAPEPERAELAAVMAAAGVGPGEVVFTGYVPDGDLVKLYNLCALYVFPSLHEGFGLPALEAMSSGAIVIGSNTSSLPEVIGRQDALFDPRDVHSIAGKISAALSDEAFRESLREHSRTQPANFSWAESARRALDAFEAAHERATHLPGQAVPVARDARERTALLPAPHSRAVDGELGAVDVFADADCSGVHASGSLERFEAVRDRYGRIVIELADDPYCAKTLPLATAGKVDILVRDERFGGALEILGRSPQARGMLVAMLYRGGGYHALKKALDGHLSAEVLADLVPAEGLAAFGESQVLTDFVTASRGATGPGLAWRSILGVAVAELLDVEGLADAPDRDCRRLARALSWNLLRPARGRQWLVDISNLFVRDAGTGIQRVVRHILDELIFDPPPGCRIEPVHLGDDGVLRYARSYCQRRYFPEETLPADEVVEMSEDDLYLGLDLAAHLIPMHLDLFRSMRNRGVRQYFVVYDLLPLLRPDCFDPPSLPVFRAWYDAIAEIADGVVCISRAVADEFERWLHQSRPERLRPLHVGFFHLGADVEAESEIGPSTDLADSRLAALADRPTFLMVGTIEPRKGHAQVLAAFERLWEQGVDVNLLIVGKPGWLVEAFLQRLREHPRRGSRLFWFESAGDDLLVAAYRRSSALIMASEGEGFGLPLIEAAHHGLPLVVRNLPVFREVAGENAHYFEGYDAADLADALRTWLELAAVGKAPQPAGVRWLTWRESANQLVELLLQQQWVYAWLPGEVRRHGAYDHRFLTQVGHFDRGEMRTSGAAGLLLYGPYVAVPAGRYRVVLYGGAGRVGDGVWVDIVSQAGARVHARTQLFAGRLPKGERLAEIDISLNADVSDLEIRIGVCNSTELWVREVEIRPSADHPITAGTLLARPSSITANAH